MILQNTLALFSIGTTEWVAIAVVALIIFGRNLPSVARSLGKSVVEFKKGIKGVSDDVDDVNDQIDRELGRQNDTGK